MPVLDSEFFPSGSGGSSVKPYVVGMNVKFGEGVRSMKNLQPYIRYSTSPTTLTLSADPANLQAHFQIDDSSTQIGTIASFLDTQSSAFGVLERNGQKWLRTGSYLEAALVGPREIPRELTHIGDNWRGFRSAASVGIPSSQIVHMTGDGNGNWMALNNTGNIYRSSDNTVSWSLVSSLTLISSTSRNRVATNSTGRWWICQQNGTVHVSDNFGTSWTQLQSIGAAPGPAFFKYMNGRLYWSQADNPYTITQTSGTSAFSAWLPDTNSPAVAWTNLSFPLAQGVPHFPAGTTAIFLDAVCNNVDTIWFTGTASNTYVCIYIYNTVTNTWYINSMGAANRVYGMSFDEQTGAAWVVTSYYINTSNVTNIYEVYMSKTGDISSIANGFRAANVVSNPTNVNLGTGYFRRGGSAFLLETNGSGSFGTFRFSGTSMATGRNPAVNGVFGSYTWWGLTVVGDMLVTYGTHLNVAVPTVGIPTNRSVGHGYSDYVRIQ